MGDQQESHPHLIEDDEVAHQMRRGHVRLARPVHGSAARDPIGGGDQVNAFLLIPGLDAGERGFRRRLRGANHTLKARAACPLGYREGSSNRSDAPVEGKLTDGGVVSEALWRKLPRGGEHSEGDGKVEAGPFLAQSGRCEVDRDPAAVRPFERGGDDSAPDAVLGLLASSVGKPDDRESGHARLEVRLDLHLPRLETDERMRDCPCEHAPTVGTKASPRGDAFVPKPSRRVAEDVKRERARVPAVVATDAQVSGDLVLGVEEGLDLDRDQLAIGCVVTPARAR